MFFIVETIVIIVCPLIKLFKLKGSHIKAAFRFEENEPESELNRELSRRSKSAKVGTRILWRTF